MVGGYARANARVMQGRGKVDPRMDSLALSNVLTWHFQSSRHLVYLDIASEQKITFHVDVLGIG